MSYETKSLSAVLCNDRSEAEYEEVRQFAFCKNGLSTKGTYIFYEDPTEVELEFIQDEKTAWALHEQFQAFSSQVEDWALLQSCVKAVGLVQPHQVMDADEYLRGESEYSSPDELQLMKDYRVAQDQANLLQVVPAGKSTNKQSFKI
jgi:hypothetical protein